MNNETKINPALKPEHDSEITPPPPLLMIVVGGLFALVIIGGGVFIFLQNRPSFSALLDLAIKVAPILTIALIAATVAFRKRLPRHLWLWLTIGLMVLWVIGSAGFVVAYRNMLAPGQRETVKFHLPFMKTFDPPLPSANDTLPTAIPNQGDISPADLLNAPLTIGSPEASTNVPAIPAPITATQAVQVEPSAAFTPTTLPTATPAVTETATIPPPTQAASAPTQASADAVVNPPITLPGSARLFGFTHVKQTWNNCGPANITMALSYYGWKQDQDYAASYLKPNREDKNVNPSELVSFVNEESGVRALTRPGGDIQLLKAFLANKIPIIIETGYNPEGYDWIGHYQTIVGYDENQQMIYLYDSYLGTGQNGSGMPEAYADFDKNWSAFNRTFIVIFKREEEAQVREILGERADPAQAAEHAAKVAQAEAAANPQNGFAWFNLGSSFTKLGRYKEAAGAFDQARKIGVPWRMTLYQFGPFEAYFNIGRYDDVTGLINVNLNNGGEYIEENFYWQGRVLAAEGKIPQAASSYRQALAHNPRFAAAKDALRELNA